MTNPPYPTALIVKPSDDAEKRAALEGAIASVRAAGVRLDVRQTERRGDAERYAAAAVRAGAPLVIAAGGDGTLNEVVNGVLSVDASPRLGLIPLGTANDFARALELPVEPAAALEVALHGVPEALDVARVNDRYFINVSTGGFGADATKSAAKGAKRMFGPLAYVAAGARRLLTLEAQVGEFVCDGRVVHRGRFIFYAVGNSRLTGGGARVTPRADLDDHRLDAVIMRGVSRLELLALLPDLRAGTHLEHPDVLYLRASRFEVRPATPLAVNADGEAVEGAAFRYDVSERPVRFMLPHDHPAL